MPRNNFSFRGEKKKELDPYLGHISESDGKRCVGGRVRGANKYMNMVSKFFCFSTHPPPTHTHTRIFCACTQTFVLPSDFFAFAV